MARTPRVNEQAAATLHSLHATTLGVPAAAARIPVTVRSRVALADENIFHSRERVPRYRVYARTDDGSYHSGRFRSKTSRKRFITAYEYEK